MTQRSNDLANEHPTDAAGSLAARRFTVDLETDGNAQLVDLTARVGERLAALPAATAGGVVHLFVVGSTAALTTVEYEPGLVGHDVAAAFQRIAPDDIEYRHEQTWNDDNGHSHVRATLVGPSLSVPFDAGGALLLGTWQQIVLIDFDTRPRRRTIIGTVL